MREKEQLKNVSHSVLYQELVKPVLIFQEPPTDPDSPAENDGHKCKTVATSLNDKKIDFALVDRGANLKIFVSSTNVPIVKEIANQSGLKFWSEWNNEFFK